MAGDRVFLRIVGKPLRAYQEFAGRWPKTYAIYVLSCLTITYLVNQLDRFLVAISSRNLSSELGFGMKGCLPPGRLEPLNGSCPSRHCASYKDNASCVSDSACTWTYLGTGTEYQVLAGPAFIVVFTLLAIPLSVSAGFKWINRKVVLSLSVVLWSLMTLLASFSANFGELLATRIGLGLFESICTPYATSILIDYFVETKRGFALGIYNWGVYIGFSLTFMFDFILTATSWRWAFRIASVLGVPVALILLLTVLEPQRTHHASLSKSSCTCYSVKSIAKAFVSPPLIAVLIAGGVRQGAGLMFSYNIKSFTLDEHCNEAVIGQFMSWVPLVGGSCGALLGGYVSDRLRKKAGRHGRIWVLVISQFVATPLAAGSVLIPLPYNFISYLLTLVVGEMWIGVCLAVVIELVPPSVASASVAVYLFAINNIGGCLNLLLPPLQTAIGLKYAFLTLYAGLYCLSAVLFTVTLILTLNWKKCRKGCCKRRNTSEVESRPLLTPEVLSSSLSYSPGIQDDDRSLVFSNSLSAEESEELLQP